MTSGKCMYCGIDPAEGFASIWRDGRESWYCHGDDDGVSCYERRTILSALKGK